MQACSSPWEKWKAGDCDITHWHSISATGSGWKKSDNVLEKTGNGNQYNDSTNNRRAYEAYYCLWMVTSQITIVASRLLLSMMLQRAMVLMECCQRHHSNNTISSITSSANSLLQQSSSSNLSLWIRAFCFYFFIFLGPRYVKADEGRIGAKASIRFSCR